MERWACVDVPALPLQLLLLREPSWRDAATAVVEADKPQARIVWVNARARQRGVRPGMRYAAGLALDPALRAGVVAAEECAASVDAIVRRLRAFSPEIEPSEREPGVLWLDASGLAGLFASLEDWAARIVASLREGGLHASVAVGFERFATYAIARGLSVQSRRRGVARGARVLASPEEERQLADRVPLDLLPIEPKLRSALDRLGIADAGALRRLPPGGLSERFGAIGRQLEEVLGGRGNDLLIGRREVEEIAVRCEREPGEGAFDAAALVLAIGERLSGVCLAVARRDEAIAVLHVRLLLEDKAPRDESLRPAQPTLQQEQLLELVDLRIARLALDAPVIGFELRVDGVNAPRAQRELFAERPRRDLAAADRGLARVRAEFGDGAVVRAELRDAHLPEGTFAWQRLDQLPRAAPNAVLRGPLVRRLLAQPQPLERDRREPDGWCAAGLAGGAVRRTFGPFVVSGGWWRREVHRAYHFVETARGDVLWVYYDRRRRRWFWHGVVE